MTDEELKPFIGNSVMVHIDSQEKGKFYISGELAIYAINCEYTTKDNNKIPCDAYWLKGARTNIDDIGVGYIFCSPEIIAITLYRDTSETAKMREAIEYCTKNGLNIPLEWVEKYNEVVKGNK